MSDDLSYLQWSMLPDEAEALRDVIVGANKPRSSGWPKKRREHLIKEPCCQVCGGKKNLNVHHKLPFHLFPANELADDNLITLCEDGLANTNCHLLVGHCGNWRDYNPTIEESANFIRKMLKNKTDMSPQPIGEDILSTDPPPF